MSKETDTNYKFKKMLSGLKKKKTQKDTVTENGGYSEQCGPGSPL